MVTIQKVSNFVITMDQSDLCRLENILTKVFMVEESVYANTLEGKWAKGLLKDIERQLDVVMDSLSSSKVSDPS